MPLFGPSRASGKLPRRVESGHHSDVTSNPNRSSRNRVNNRRVTHRVRGRKVDPAKSAVLCCTGKHDTKSARKTASTRIGKETEMTTLTRRSVLRSSVGLVAVGALARPHVANAAATTAELWWVQGFAQEEDIAFKKLT